MIGISSSKNISNKDIINLSETNLGTTQKSMKHVSLKNDSIIYRVLNKRIDGYVNLDKFDTFNPEYVHDLETFPYPFKDNSVEEIILSHVLEHIHHIF